MFKNGQTRLKNLYTTRFQKYIWPFFNIMDEMVNHFVPISPSFNATAHQLLQNTDKNWNKWGHECGNRLTH